MKKVPVRVRTTKANRVLRSGSVPGLEPGGGSSILPTLTKDPKKVKAGKARWKGVSKKRKHELLSAAGKKGAAAMWRKYKLVRLSTGGA